MNNQKITYDCENYSYNTIISSDCIDDFQNLSKKDQFISLIRFFLTLLMELELAGKLRVLKGQHSLNRQNYRNGYREKVWHTLIGDITLEIPKLRYGTYTPFFSGALDELSRQYRRLSVYAYVCGVTTRLVGTLFKLIGLKPVDKSSVSVNSKQILEKEEEEFDSRDLSVSSFPVVMIDAVYERVRLGCLYDRMATIVVSAVDISGIRRILDVVVTTSENRQTYLNVLRRLKERGLKTPSLIISDAHSAIQSAVREIFPGSLWQRCAIHLIRESLKKVSKDNRGAFYRMIRSVYESPDYQTAKERIEELSVKFKASEKEGVKTFLTGVYQTLTFLEFPGVSYHKLYSSNLLERLNRSIRKRTRISEQFPNEESYRRLVISWFKNFMTCWDNEAYLSPKDMIHITYRSQMRREKLEDTLGQLCLEAPKLPVDIRYIYLSCDSFQLNLDHVNQNVSLILVEVMNEQTRKQVIDAELITGIDTRKKYDRIVESIRSCVSSDSDYLIIMEHGHPELEWVVESAFDQRHIQYSLRSFPDFFLPLLPNQIRESVAECFNLLDHSEDYQQVLKMIDSFDRLWTPFIPEVVEVFKEQVSLCFNFLRFSDFYRDRYAALGRIKRIRTNVTRVYEEAIKSGNFQDINETASGIINEQNREWGKKISTFSTWSKNPKKRRKIERKPDPALPVDREILPINTDNWDDEMVQFITLHTSFWK